jgi:hypothetical protein
MQPTPLRLLWILLLCPWGHLLQADTLNACGCAVADSFVLSPMFAEEEILQLTIQADLKTLLKDKGEDPEYQSIKLQYTEGEKVVSLTGRAKVRGHFRKKTCKFPPLRIKADSAAAIGTLFEGLGKIKLVTHCNSKKAQFEQLILQEYLVYRAYNQLTEHSFRARLLRITYEDSRGKYEPLVRYGFFIEPTDHLENRLGGRIQDVKKIHPKLTAGNSADLLAVFEYMVGNTDWSVPNLHNVEMLTFANGQAPVPIPYDFDWCGLVDAPYAFPNPQFGTNTVQERVFRGFCTSKEEFEAIFELFIDKKESIHLEIAKIEGFSEKVRAATLDYLEEFYEILHDPKSIEREFYEGCRTDR